MIGLYVDREGPKLVIYFFIFLGGGVVEKFKVSEP